MVGKSAEEKFEVAVDEVVFIGAMQLGLHTSFIAALLARKAKEQRELGEAVDRLSANVV
jgi:hypothetical protein